MERLTKRDSFDGKIELTRETWEPIAPYDEVIEALGKLADYEDAEEQGRIVRLPCKVGDTVYVVKNVVSRGYPDPIITKQIFEEKFRYEHLNFPKAVYLTYEEAEAALGG